MNPLLRLLALVAVLCAAPAHAQYLDLDPSFNGSGLLSLGFQPVGDAANNRDVAIVACAGPQGSLVVAGRASGDRRIVVAWLTEGGALDTRFSVDGKESFDLPAASMGSAVGLCAGDGTLVIAYNVGVAGGEYDLRVLRIDPATGRPDPAFGNGGTLAIDLDVYGNLGREETPLALNVGAAGDILLSGRYRYGASDEHRGGFVLRVTASGTVAARYLSHLLHPVVQDISVAVPHPDGTIWAIARHNVAPAPTAALLRLDAATLARIDMPQPALGERLTVYSGRLVGREALAFAAASGADLEPQLWTLDPLAITRYDLPVPRVGGLPQAVVLAQVVPLPDGDLLYTGSLAPRAGVVQAERGAFLAQRVPLTTTFAKAAPAPLVVRHSPLPGCAPGDHVLMRTTLWAGRPTMVGAFDLDCGSANVDYLVARLALDPPAMPVIFIGGFESAR